MHGGTVNFLFEYAIFRQFQKSFRKYLTHAINAIFKRKIVGKFRGVTRLQTLNQILEGCIFLVVQNQGVHYRIAHRTDSDL
mgnify:CR=1 FL=1